jgi:hypothetical protein
VARALPFLWPFVDLWEHREAVFSPYGVQCWRGDLIIVSGTSRRWAATSPVAVPTPLVWYGVTTAGSNPLPVLAALCMQAVHSASSQVRLAIAGELMLNFVWDDLVVRPGDHGHRALFF